MNFKVNSRSIKPFFYLFLFIFIEEEEKRFLLSIGFKCLRINQLILRDSDI